MSKMVQDKCLELNTLPVTPLLQSLTRMHLVFDTFAAGYDPSLDFAKSHFTKRSDSKGDSVDGDDYDLHWENTCEEKKKNSIPLTTTFSGKNVIIISRSSSVQKYFTHFLNSSLQYSS